MNPKILILGHGRHGKDTTAELLAESLNLKFSSSSWHVAELIFKFIQQTSSGWFYYKSVKECFDDRHNCREYWKQFISDYCSEDPQRLAREVLEVADIYVGMRTNREYEASKCLFDYIVYVDAGFRSGYVDMTMEIPYNEKTMLYVDNNGSIEQLEQQVSIISEIISGGANYMHINPQTVYPTISTAY